MRWTQIIGYTGSISLLLLFCFIPLAIVALPAFHDGERPSFAIIDQIGDRRNIDIILFTLGQASISAVATVLFALPGAYLMARYRFPGRSVLMALTMVPFVIPPLVLSVGFLTLFGAHGYVNRLAFDMTGEGSALSILYTPYAIILAHVFLNFPVALRILHSRFLTMDRTLIRSSEIAGGGPMRTFFKVVLPQLKYSLMASASLVFTFCFLSFGVILVIGGMTNATIEVEIFRQFGGGNDRAAAGSLLIVQTLILLAATAVYHHSSRKEESRSTMLRGKGIGSEVAMHFPARVGIVVYIIFAALIVLGPLLSVGMASLSPTGVAGGEITLDNYRSVLTREDDPTIGATPIEAVRNSFLFAFIATSITIPLSMAVAYLLDSKPFRGRSFLDVLILFPLGSSAIALGYGLAKGAPGAILSGTWMIIIVVHSLLAYPFCVRTITAAKREIDPSTVLSSLLMGASRSRTFMEVELPILIPGIAIGGAFVFAISLGEMGATYMVFSPEYATMPIALYQFISGGRDLGAVAAYSVILMLVTAASLLFVDVTIRSLGRILRWL